MNKKKYYQLLHEYQKEVSKKKFNVEFYDNTRLEEIKNQLLRTIYVFRQRLSIGQYPDVLYMEKEKLKYLEEKLKHEEEIQDEDYENTYCEPMVCGLVSWKWFLIGLGITIVSIIARMLIIRW